MSASSLEAPPYKVFYDTHTSKYCAVNTLTGEQTALYTETEAQEEVMRRLDKYVKLNADHSLELKLKVFKQKMKQIIEEL